MVTVSASKGDDDFAAKADHSTNRSLAGDHRSDVQFSDPLVDLSKEYLRRQLRGIPAGDGLERVWHELYRRHDRWIRDRVHESGLAEDVATDCAQEVWVCVSQRLTSFVPEGPQAFRGWLLKIIRSKIIDRQRQEFRQPTPCSDKLPTLHVSIRCHKSSPVTVLVQQEDSKLAETLVNKLQQQVSRENYELFRRRWLEGHSVAEIAASSHLPARQITYRLARVLKKLRKIANDAA